MIDRRVLGMLGVGACLILNACGGDTPAPPANSSANAGGTTPVRDTPPSTPPSHTPPSITFGNPPTTQPGASATALDPETANRIDRIHRDIAAGRIDDADRLLSTLELNKSRLPPEVRASLSETRRTINQARHSTSTQPAGSIDPDSVLK